MGPDEPLEGGIANAGKVVRVGDTVRRPATEHSAGVFALLTHLRDVGFDGAARPLGFDAQGREVLSYVPGDVPVPPYPAWSMSDAALASVAKLQRRLHDAAAGFDPSSYRWSDELADVRGGDIVTHNDLCPENVVFRDGEAIAFLDWDFAAPGRALWDVVTTMSMWCPVRDPMGDEALGMGGLDPFRRARVVSDAYGLDERQRQKVPDVFFERLEISFVEKRAAAGEQAFVEMLARQGGPGRGARRRRWLEEHADALRAALA
jgi:hypothetical protein